MKMKIINRTDSLSANQRWLLDSIKMHPNHRLKQPIQTIPELETQTKIACSHWIASLSSSSIDINTLAEDRPLK